MDRRLFIKSAGVLGALSPVSLSKINAPGLSSPDADNEQYELMEKQFYALGSRQYDECYHPVTESVSGGQGLAFLRVADKRESLVFKPSLHEQEIVLSQNAYCFNPVILKDYILWIESRDNQTWDICCISMNEIKNQKVSKPFDHRGRPLSLYAHTRDEEAFLVWEERSGRSTRIMYACISGAEISGVTTVTGGSFNAYDPVITLAEDGFLYIAYTAFYQGNYRIMVQKVTREGALRGAPILFCDGPEACLYPSICASNTGGVWISFTQLNGTRFHYLDSIALVHHHRHAAQRRFFESHGNLKTGLFKEGQIFAPIAPDEPWKKQGSIAAMDVYGTQYCGKSQVFEDINGNLHVIFRQHADVETAEFLSSEGKLRRSGKKTTENPGNNYSGLSICTLQDRIWSKPARLVRHAHFEMTPSFNLVGDRLTLAFMEDSRFTGWTRSGEYFDQDGQTGVGIIKIKLKSSSQSDYEFRPFRIRPGAAEPIENPPMDTRKGSYIHACGQTHFHSSTSVCVRELDRDHHTNFRFMQDVQHCDFGCLSDHGYNMWHTEMLWMRKLAEYYYFPGDFISFQAYEWTGSNQKFCSHEGGPWGHLNPLYLEEKGDLDVYPPSDPDCDGSSLQKLAKVYGGKKIVAPPHHPADNAHPFHWDFFNPELSPVVEVFQELRGSAEHPMAPGTTNFIHRETGHWVMDALKAGKKFGFIASADHGGLARAGVLVKELTRTGLYEALKARRSFGTTGLAMRLEFTGNGQPMGTELSADRVDFELQLTAIYPVREVQIVRNGEDVSVQEADSNQFRYNWTAEKKESGEFWYCRIIFRNGEMAWSSPIWLT